MPAKADKNPSTAFKIYHLFWSSLDWLYPPVCGGCGKTGYRWCEDCQQEIINPGKNICTVCGDVLPIAGKLCQNCINNPPAYKYARSFGVFNGPLRKAILRLKYKRDVGLGEALSFHLIQYFKELNWDIDIVVSVPLSPKRLIDRGYNQATLLARPFAFAYSLSFQPNLLRKIKETRTQVGLSADQRFQNVNNAFVANRNKVKNKSILLIDDVATTGATLHSCAQTLKSCDAKEIYCLTLARASFQSEASKLE